MSFFLCPFESLVTAHLRLLSLRLIGTIAYDYERHDAHWHGFAYNFRYRTLFSCEKFGWQGFARTF